MICIDFSTCPAGQGQVTAGNASSDTVCSDCVEGKYSTENDNSACAGIPTICTTDITMVRYHYAYTSFTYTYTSYNSHIQYIL